MLRKTSNLSMLPVVVYLYTQGYVLLYIYGSSLYSKNLNYAPRLLHFLSDKSPCCSCLQIIKSTLIIWIETKTNDEQQQKLFIQKEANRLITLAEHHHSDREKKVLIEVSYTYPFSMKNVFRKNIYFLQIPLSLSKINLNFYCRDSYMTLIRGDSLEYFLIFAIIIIEYY